MLKRLMAFLLTTVMVIGVFPISTSANEDWATTVMAEQLEGVYFQNQKIADAVITDGLIEVTVPYLTDNEIKAIVPDGKGRQRAEVFFNFDLSVPEDLIPEGFVITGFTGESGRSGDIQEYIDMLEDSKDGDTQDYGEEGVLTDSEVKDRLISWLYDYNEVAADKHTNPTSGAAKIRVAEYKNGEVRRSYEPGEVIDDTVHIMWYDENKNEAIYQKFDVFLIFAEPTMEQLLVDWEGKFITSLDQITADMPKAFTEENAISYKIENSVIVCTLDLDELDVNDWKAAYEEGGAGETQITGLLSINPPSGKVEKVYDEVGNGELAFGPFKGRSEQNAYEYDGEQPMGGALWFAQINRSGNKVTIIPSVNEGNMFARVAWIMDDGSTVYQMMPFRFELEGEARSIEFDDTLNYVPSGRIESYDERANIQGGKLKASFDEGNHKVVYKYEFDYSQTVIGSIPEMILSDLSQNQNAEPNRFKTMIKAPDGYLSEDGEAFVPMFTDFVSRDGSQTLQGSSNMLEYVWIKYDNTVSGPERIVEYIGSDFDPGITYMDAYWNPITEASRIEFYTAEGTLTTEEILENGGLVVEFENGKVETSFNQTKTFDTETVPNAYIEIAPPNDGNLYVGYRRNHNNGDREIYYNMHMADFIDGIVRDGDFFRLDETEGENYNRNIAVANFANQTINGIEVWFTDNPGGAYVLIIDWYTDDPTVDPNAQPAKREYIYVEQDDYINKVEANHITEEEDITAPITNITTISEGTFLTCGLFPQNNAGNQDAYYFQLEGDENTPSGEKVIYIPYGYFGDDIDYAAALAQNKVPKLHHYYDDHTEKELIKGTLTPYGMRFVISDFSPFVLDWEDAENTGTASANKETVTVIIDGAGKPKEENEQNPNTGAPVCNAAAGIVFVLAAALFGKK